MIPRSLAIAAAALLITGCATQWEPDTTVFLPHPNLWHGAPVTCDNLPPGSQCLTGEGECVGDCTAYNAERRDAEAAQAGLKAIKDQEEEQAAADEARIKKEEQQAAAARRRAAERAAKAAEAAVEKAKAEEAKADQDFDDAHPIGARCESTLGRFETDVLSSLSRTQKAIVLSSRCSSQHKILQAVGILPPERRIEAFDRLLDSAAR